MAVVHRNSASLDEGGTITPNTTGSNRLFFYTFSAYGNNQVTITQDDLGSTDMVQAASYQFPQDHNVGVWLNVGHGYILDTNIPTGSNAINTAWSAAVTEDTDGAVYEFSGVDQTTPIEALASHTRAEEDFTGGNPSDIDLDVEDGDAVVIFVYGPDGDTITFGGEWTNSDLLIDAAQGIAHIWSGYKLVTADDANYVITMSYTGSGNGAWQAFVIKGAAATQSPVPIISNLTDPQSGGMAL